MPDGQLRTFSRADPYKCRFALLTDGLLEEGLDEIALVIASFVGCGESCWLAERAEPCRPTSDRRRRRAERRAEIEQHPPKTRTG